MSTAVRTIGTALFVFALGGTAHRLLAVEADRLTLSRGAPNHMVEHFTGVEDARLEAGPHEAFNYGGDPLLAVGCDGAGNERRSLLRFRVTTLAGRVPKLDSARVRLAVAKNDGFGGGEILVYALGSGAHMRWIEGESKGQPYDVGACYLQPNYNGAKASGWDGGAPGAADSTLIATISYTGQTAIAVDLPADVVMGWVLKANGGLLLAARSAKPGAALWLHASEAARAEDRPSLALTGKFGNLPEKPLPLVNVPPFDPVLYNKLENETFAYLPREWKGRWIQTPKPPQLALELDEATRKSDAWDFDEGDLEDIAEVGAGLKNAAVSNGAFVFDTELPKAYFAFGNLYENPTSGAKRIHLNADWYGDQQWMVEIRMRQSLSNSVWTLRAREGNGSPQPPREFTLRGTNWQTVRNEMGTCNAEWYDALALETFTPGNRVEIDSVRVGPLTGPERFRKVFTLEGEPARAWCTVITPFSFKVYVNGELVGSDRMYINISTMPRIEIPARCLRVGENVIAVEVDNNGGPRRDRRGMYFQGIVRTRDGQLQEVLSDGTWKSSSAPVPSNWLMLGYSEQLWAPAVDVGNPYELGYTQFTENDLAWNNPFIPPYFGALELEFDGVRQPFYDCVKGKPLSLAVRLPGARSAAKEEVRWRAWNPDTGAEAGRGTLRDWTVAGCQREGAMTFQPPVPGVYFLNMDLVRDGVVVDHRWAEIVAIGKFDMPETRTPEAWRAAQKLTLVDDIDCAQTPDRLFIDGPELGSSRVVRDGDLTFRMTGVRTAALPERNWFSYGFKVRDRRKPHVIVVDVPTIRATTMQVWCTTPYHRSICGTMCLYSSNGSWNRFPYPLQPGLAQFSALIWPNYEENVVTISDYSVGMLPVDESEGAAAARIRVYEVDGVLPAAAVAHESGRLVGSHSERWDVITSNFTGGPGSPIKYGYYEHYRAMANLARYLRYRGDNFFWAGMHMYSIAQYPSEKYDGEQYGNFSRNWHGFKYGPDLADLLMRVMQANDIKMVLGIQYVNSIGLRPELQVTAGDIRDGAATALQISRRGDFAQGWPGVRVNPLHPKVKDEMADLVRELAARYGQYDNILGVGFPSMAQGLMPSFYVEGPNVWDYSFDDMTVSRFEKETGVKLPLAPDPRQRFEHRAKWIRANCADRWLQWRAGALASVVESLDQVAEQATGGKWVAWHAPCNNTVPDLRQKGHADTGDKPLPMDCWVANGVDGDTYKNLSNVVLVGSYSFVDRRGSMDKLRSSTCREFLTDPKLHAWMQQGKTRGSWIGESFFEYDLVTPVGCRWLTDWTREFTASRLQHQVNIGRPAFALYGAAYGSPLGRSYLDELCHVLALGDPDLVLTHWSDVSFPQGPDVLHAELTRTVRALPKGRYSYVPGGGTEDDVVVKSAATPDGTALLVINPAWWKARVELETAPAARLFDRVTGEKVASVLELEPYGIRVLQSRKTVGVKKVASGIEPAAVAHLRKLYRMLAQTPVLFVEPSRQALMDGMQADLAAGRHRRAWERMLKPDAVAIRDVTLELVDPAGKPDALPAAPIPLQPVHHTNALVNAGFEGIGAPNGKPVEHLPGWWYTQAIQARGTNPGGEQVVRAQVAAGAARSGKQGVVLDLDMLQAVADKDQDVAALRLKSAAQLIAKPGSWAVASVWARSVRGAPKILISMLGERLSGGWFYYVAQPGDPVNTFALTPDWRRYVLAVKLPADMDPAKGISLFVDLREKGATVQMDDFELYVVDAAVE